MDQQFSSQPPPMPGNHLVLAILSTVLGFLCCSGINLPFGIVAIVFASQVNGKYASGDFQGAISSAKQAKIWGWISMGLVILGFVLCLLGLLLMFFIGINDPYAFDDPYMYDTPQYEDPYTY
ncbi:MAG: CD225/dispanin family protein [Opitutae bacterium]|nr:CD225/dispanin family protein [Opitutae bacterium]